MKDLRIATVIFHSPIVKPNLNVEKMIKWIEMAKAEGAAIVCFPEMNISGYCIDPDLADTAEPIPGSIAGTLSNLSRQINIVVLAGIAEKSEDNRIFASHMVIKPDGYFGIYRKLHLAPPERSVFTAGNEIPLFKTHGTCFGIQLCYDAHFPELSTVMALKGAEIIFIPHASPRGTPEEKFDSWMRHLPARAYDNGLFIIACNQTGENGKSLSFPGIAVAIDPSGKIIDKNVGGKEGMMLVDVKSEVLEAVRQHRMRYFLPHRRPNLYKLKVRIEE